MDEMRRDQQSESKGRMWAGIVIVGVLLFILLAILWSSGVLGPKESAEVPDVIGMTVQDARRALREVGLGIDRIDRVYSVTMTEGTVLAQTPSSGSVVPRGTDLMLGIARGVEEGTVPDVSAMDVEEAVRAVEAAGYTVVIEGKPVKTPAPGTVIGQSPGEGRAEPGSKVTLVVAVGVIQDIVTPNVVGLEQPAAVSVLHDVGLKSRSYWVTSSTSGEVLHQYPPAGMPVAPGTTVELSVAQGMDNPTLPTEGIGP